MPEVGREREKGKGKSRVWVWILRQCGIVCSRVRLILKFYIGFWRKFRLACNRFEIKVTESRWIAYSYVQKPVSAGKIDRNWNHSRARTWQTIKLISRIKVIEESTSFRQTSGAQRAGKMYICQTTTIICGSNVLYQNCETVTAYTWWQMVLSVAKSKTNTVVF